MEIISCSGHSDPTVLLLSAASHPVYNNNLVSSCRASQTALLCEVEIRQISLNSPFPDSLKIPTLQRACQLKPLLDTLRSTYGVGSFQIDPPLLFVFIPLPIRRTQIARAHGGLSESVDAMVWNQLASVSTARSNWG